MFVLSKQSKKETYFDILDSKEFFLDLKSETLAKSKKSAFCKGVSPWFLSKNRPYSYQIFFEQKGKKETFFDILDKKQCFLAQQRKVLKNSKKIAFCKRVSPWFLCKNRPFSYNIFFEQKRKKETFFDILDRK